MSLVRGRPLFRPGHLSPTAWWKLDYDGTITADSSGSYTLTEVNAAGDGGDDYWVSGEASAQFDGTDDAYYATRDATLDCTGSFSMGGWVNCDDLGDNEWIFGKDGADDGYDLYITSAGDVTANIGGDALSFTSSAITAKRWHHIVVTYNTTANVACCYQDGNLVHILTANTDPSNTDNNLYIGSDAAGGNEFDGKLKDLFIISGTVLTPIQIKSLALGQDLSKYPTRPGTNGVPAPTVWWKMNEAVASGTRADSIGSLDLTDNGTVPTGAGYIEGAAPHLDGSADYFSASDNTAFDFSDGTFSISAWINPDTVAGNDIIYQQSTDADNYFQFRLESGVLNLSVVTATSEVVNVAGATTLTVGKWSHVAVTESGDTWKVYLNGKDDTDSGGTDAQRALNYTGDIRIGTDHAGANDFDGLIADVAIWKSTALTAEQVRKLACGLDINDQACVFYAPFSAATDANETDMVGGRTLTETGTVTSATGQVGNCKDFENTAAATNNYYTVTRDADLDLLDAWGIFAWVKAESEENYHTLVDKDGAGNGYAIRFNAGSAIVFTTGGADPKSSSSTLDLATWYGIGVVYNQATMSFYINGKVDASSAYTTDNADESENMLVGAYVGPLNGFDGLMDELVMFKRAPHPDEITALYLKGYNGKEFWHSDKSSSGFFAVLNAT